MLTFELADIEAARTLVERFGVFTLAESLGGVKGLIAHAGLMTDAAMMPKARARAGTSEAYCAGRSGCEVLLADLSAALAAVLLPVAAAAACEKPDHDRSSVRLSSPGRRRRLLPRWT